MRCSHCQSDDVVKSHRKLLERPLLFLLKAQVYRCRDCHRRFRAEAEWGPVILGFLVMVVAAGVALAMVVARRSTPRVDAHPPRAVRLPKRARPLPPGLPPLSGLQSSKRP